MAPPHGQPVTQRRERTAWVAFVQPVGDLGQPGFLQAHAAQHKDSPDHQHGNAQHDTVHQGTEG